MGKKKPEEMAEHRAIFREGAAKKGISAEVADEVFDLMEKFAGYGFNKSHAAAYSLLAYHTAWIKAHFAAEFFAANMSVEIDNSDKLKALLVDAKAFGVTIETPDVNTGTYRFEPVAADSVRYGLGAIKGTGQGAIEAIVAAREDGGPFTSLFDFCARVDRGRINRRVVEALVKAGAFDALQPGALVAAGERRPGPRLGRDAGGARRPGRPVRRSSTAATRTARARQEPPLVAAREWSIKERLTLEKSALGFYLSGHLFDQSAAEVRRFAKLRIADLIDTREPLLLAGIVGDLRVVNGQRGRVAIFKLDDMSDSIEAVANEELLDRQPRAAQGRRAGHRPGQASSPTASPAACASTCRACGTSPARAAASASTCASRSTAASRRWPRCCATSRRAARRPSTARCQEGLRVRLQLQRARGDRRARPRRRRPLLPERRRAGALADQHARADRDRLRMTVGTPEACRI